MSLLNFNVLVIDFWFYMFSVSANVSFFAFSPSLLFRKHNYTTFDIWSLMFVLVPSKFIYSEIGPFNIHFNPYFDRLKSNILRIREINFNMNKVWREQNKTIKIKRKLWHIF